jgi:hypothetical protein
MKSVTFSDPMQDAQDATALAPAPPVAPFVSTPRSQAPDIAQDQLQSTSRGKSKSGKKTAAIVGGVAATAVILGLALVGFVLFRRSPLAGGAAANGDHPHPVTMPYAPFAGVSHSTAGPVAAQATSCGPQVQHRSCIGCMLFWVLSPAYLAWQNNQLPILAACRLDVVLVWKLPKALRVHLHVGRLYPSRACAWTCATLLAGSVTVKQMRHAGPCGACRPQPRRRHSKSADREGAPALRWSGPPRPRRGNGLPLCRACAPKSRRRLHGHPPTL